MLKEATGTITPHKIYAAYNPSDSVVTLDLFAETGCVEVGLSRQQARKLAYDLMQLTNELIDLEEGLDWFNSDG